MDVKMTYLKVVFRGSAVPVPPDEPMNVVVVDELLEGAVVVAAVEFVPFPATTENRPE